MAAAVTEAADLLSDLSDDLLLRILFFLPAASDVARASALSRRWRHLWPLAAALRFNVGSIPKANNGRIDYDAARRLNAAVTAVLARRGGGGGPDVEDLEITLIDDFGDGPYCSSAQIAEWLLFAASRVTGRFDLAVPSPATRKFRAIWHPNPTAKATDNDEEKILSATLPSSARFMEMSLSLGSAILSIPVATGPAIAFSALTDVVLSFARIAGGDDGRLSNLLSSSCCPRLRRLQMMYVDGLTALRLRAASTLEEIRLVFISKLESLEVDAPGLRVLDLERCFDIEAARISAPRLEVLAGEHIGQMEGLFFDGTESVRRIERLQMCSHRNRLKEEYYMDSELAVWLLRHCTGLNCLGLEVELPSWSVKKHDVVENVYKDMIMDIPQLPNITRLTVTVHGSRHNIGATVAKLIAKFPRIEYLSIHIPLSFIMEECLDPSCICNLPENWEKQLISLEYLRIVEIYGLMPFGNRACLVGLLLRSSPGLESMTVSLPQLVVKNIQEETGQEVIFEIPCYGGFWEPCAWDCCERGFRGVTEYKWTPGRQERAMN